MQHLKNYMVKIETMIADMEKKPAASKSKGLLSSSKTATPKDKPKNELDVIANIVYNLRKERKGMLNG
jgi:hypothetical protein